jgi:hypothetical protein
MKFAFADPPYYGKGKSMYGNLHPDAKIWDEKNSHLELLDKLVNEYPDGWVLCCNPKDLVWLLPHAPEEVRVGAWVKTFHQIRKVTNQYAWECVLFYGGREEKGRKPMVRDWLQACIAMKKGTPGAKPKVFNEWVLDLLNAKEKDIVVDLYPGSGGLEIPCKERKIKYKKSC